MHDRLNGNLLKSRRLSETEERRRRDWQAEIMTRSRAAGNERPGYKSRNRERVTQKGHRSRMPILLQLP